MYRSEIRQTMQQERWLFGVFGIRSLFTHLPPQARFRRLLCRPGRAHGYHLPLRGSISSQMILVQRCKVLALGRRRIICTKPCRKVRIWKSVMCGLAQSTPLSAAGRKNPTCAYGTTFTRPLLSSSYLKGSGLGLFVAIDQVLNRTLNIGSQELTAPLLLAFYRSHSVPSPLTLLLRDFKTNSNLLAELRVETSENQLMW